MTALQELDDHVHRMHAEEEADSDCSTAITQLLRGKVNNSLRHMPTSVFFATLAMRLKRKPAWWMPTAGVDGTHLFYNPDWILSLTGEHRIGIMAHEVLHLSNAHHARRGHRGIGKWNVACDLAINPLLLEAGFKLPDGCLHPKQYGLPVGLSAEEYYSKLPEQPGDGDGDGGSGNDPGGCGSVMDGGKDSSEMRQQQENWKIATTQAANVAKRIGDLPECMEKMVDIATAPQIDWRSELREFINTHAKNDYSWIPPNRRFVHMGLYLPSCRSDELGDIAVAVDTSGSISQEELNLFASEVQEVASLAHCTVTILYHDSRVARVQRWEPTEGPLVLTPAGGGGTDHRPVFEWISQHGEPTCLICCTDLCSRFPDAPTYPVLWVTREDSQGPFGRTLRIQ